MKRLGIMLLLISLVLGPITACSNRTQKEEDNLVKQNSNEYVRTYQSLEDILEDTDLVVSARVKDREDFAPTSHRYELDILDMHFGQITKNTPAFLYAGADTLEDDKVYTLFLQADQVVLYPHLVLSLVHEELVIEEDGDTDLNILIGDQKLSSSLEEMKEHLSKAKGSDLIYSFKALDANSVDDAIDLADIIVLARIKSNDEINPYVNSYQIEVIEAFDQTNQELKVEEAFTIALSPGLEIGESYYLSLKSIDGGNFILAGSGQTILAKDSLDAKTLEAELND